MASQKGPTTLTTILPGAVLGPVLLADSLGSVQIVERLMSGRVPGTPRLGFSVVDVRDVADLHIRAMTSSEAAGQRFIATDAFLWMADISRTLRDRLGARARKAPTSESWIACILFVMNLVRFAKDLSLALFQPLISCLQQLMDRNKHESRRCIRDITWIVGLCRFDRLTATIT